MTTTSSLSVQSVEKVLPPEFYQGALSIDDHRLEQAAIELAKALQKRASELQTPAERRQQAELDRMLEHPEDKATLTQITDQSFRSNSPGRVVDQMVHILDVQGVPRFFSMFDQALLKGFQSFGEYLPGVAVPLVKEKMRKETANVILPAEEEKLRGHLSERTHEGVRMNVNFLGEAILGEQECRKRLDRYLSALFTDLRLGSRAYDSNGFGSLGVALPRGGQGEVRSP
jgi:RHH-type transcriptional regulator, proline utilization regulon repressor / proline dehydrogenase / delta 1-pyrroline-5-carboxylate dehydrogenase